MSGHQVRRIFISVSGNDIRMRMDGSDPTATVGHLISSGGSFSLTGANYRAAIKNLKFIQVSAAGTIFGTAFD